jgi:hypothetical protein
MMPPWNEVARQVSIVCYGPVDASVSHFRDWGGASEWVRMLMDSAAAEGSDDIGALDSLIATTTSKYEQIAAVAHYVRDEIRYVGVEIGEGRLRPRPPNTTLANRYGDCKDKVTLMRALLGRLGIPSWPVLACVGDHVDRTFPSPLQFNHCILAVATDGFIDELPTTRAVHRNLLFFDPTDVSHSLGNLSGSLAGSVVLPAVPETDGPLVLPEIRPSDRRRQYSAAATLHPDGSLSADVRVIDFGLLAEESAYNWNRLSESERKESWQAIFSDIMQSPQVDGLSILREGDSAEIAFQLTGESIMTCAGDLNLLKCDIFNADRPHLPVHESRTFPVALGAPRMISTQVVWEFPVGWAVAETIKPVKASCETATLQSRVEMSESGAMLDWSIEYAGSRLEPSRYAEAEAFFRALQTVTNTRLILSEN